MRTLSLCTCCRHYPGAASGRRLRSSHPAVSAFPERVVGSACTSSFSRLARRSLALRPAHSRRHLYVTCYPEGFSHFVTSMTAPVASGWSVSPGGTCTHWKAPPFTAHARSGRPSWSSRQSGTSSGHSDGQVVVHRIFSAMFLRQDDNYTYHRYCVHVISSEKALIGSTWRARG